MVGKAVSDMALPMPRPALPVGRWRAILAWRRGPVAGTTLRSLVIAVPRRPIFALLRRRTILALRRSIALHLSARPIGLLIVALALKRLRDSYRGRDQAQGCS